MYEIFARLLAERGLKPADITRETGINQLYLANGKRVRASQIRKNLLKSLNS